MSIAGWALLVSIVAVGFTAAKFFTDLRDRKVKPRFHAQRACREIEGNLKRLEDLDRIERTHPGTLPWDGLGPRIAKDCKADAMAGFLGEQYRFRHQTVDKVLAFYDRARVVPKYFEEVLNSGGNIRSSLAHDNIEGLIEAARDAIVALREDPAHGASDDEV